MATIGFAAGRSTLAALGDAGPNLAVVAALEPDLERQTSPEPAVLRSQGVGSISFKMPDNMNASATIYSIGQVAVDAYKAELARAEERRDAAVEAANNVGVGPFEPSPNCRAGRWIGWRAAGGADAIGLPPRRTANYSSPFLCSRASCSLWIMD